MGALTSNRKRGDEYLSLNHGIPSLNSPNSNFPSSKRPRLLSPSMNPTPVSSKSAISRVSRYPDAKSPLPRLHAPCGNLKFGPNPGSIRRPASRDREPVSSFDDVMGNFFSSNYFRAKNSAFAACRYLYREKDSIEADTDVEGLVILETSEDSSVEEVVVVEGTDRDGGGGDDDMDRGNVPEPDAKMADGAHRLSSPSTASDLSNATLKVGNLSLDVDPGMSGVSVYKKLLRAVEDRTPKLNQLSFDIEFNEQRMNLFKSMRLVKKSVEETPREPFIPLTKEEETEVQRAFSANRRKVLVAHENSNIEITGQVLQCLRPGAWLNDEVINVYLELLKEREKRDPKSFLKCHFFNTFFYKKLILGGGYDYKSVRRWTTQRKLGYSLVDCDKIFVPVHKEIHWCLAVINKKEEKFQYLDSLGGRDKQVMNVLERYYADEVKDKCGKEINLSSWKHEFVEDLPEQQNGFDCGVFMIKYADFYSRGSRLCFSQKHMPYFRLRTAKEILRLRAE